MMLLAVADVLIDAALVLGGEATLKILYMKLVEVCLAVVVFRFCIYIIQFEVYILIVKFLLVLKMAIGFFLTVFLKFYFHLLYSESFCILSLFY